MKLDADRELAEKLHSANIDAEEVLGRLVKLYGPEVFQNIIDKIKEICITMFSTKDIEYPNIYITHGTKSN